MYRVSICDDNKEFLELFHSQVDSILKSMFISYEINLYNQALDFIEDLNDGVFYNIIFLDIEFINESMSGISVAGHIRNALNNINSHIVFVSSQPEYAMSLFEMQPFNFLIKPISADLLSATLYKSTHQWHCNQNIFSFTSERKEVNIPFGNITFIESYGRKKELHCFDETVYPLNLSLTELKNILNPYNFFSPHKSYIVNYSYVALWHINSIELINGLQIQIGRSHRNEIQQIQLKNDF